MSNRLKSHKVLLSLTFLLAITIYFSYWIFFENYSSGMVKNHNDGIIKSEATARVAMSQQELRLQLDELTKPLHTLGPINSILVNQHGELVAEQYFGSMNANRGHNIKSASKSLLSILVGIAIDKGYLEGVHQPIGEFFPEYFQNNPDSLKAAITIEDLLTMRSGLASTSRANYGRWVSSSNWIRYALDRPLQGTPGIDRIYSTGNTHLLAVILHRATGMNTLHFANRYLFGPMDIRLAGWDRDPQGYFLGGNNMAMRPRDLVKIGRLMMDV
ncbi:MAG: class C beta-lactamase-related serine hydrolase, partial [Balneolaceae bacterium]